MKKAYKTFLPLFFTIACFGCIVPGYAQKKVNWYGTFGVGATDVRSFTSSLADISYEIRGVEANDFTLSYRLSSSPGVLLSGGFGVSGSLQSEGLLSWDTGLNIRTAGFRIKANLYEMSGTPDGVSRDNLPVSFDEWRNHRYWAAHLPLSLNYLPFEVVGFTVGADLYYQFSKKPTTDSFPYGTIGESIGFSSQNTPKYQHPFQIGGHIGVFAPLGEKIRLDLQFVTDVVSRLKVSRHIGDMSYREMGAMLNIRYNLGW